MIHSPRMSQRPTSSSSCSPNKSFRRTINIIKVSARSSWQMRKMSVPKSWKSSVNSVKHIESWNSQLQFRTAKTQYKSSWSAMEQASLPSSPWWIKSRISNGMMLTQSPWSMESETQTSLSCTKRWCLNSLTVSPNTSLFWLSLEVKTLFVSKTKVWTLFLNAIKVTFNRFWEKIPRI